MQVFRLMEAGLPDKVIAFDELPARLVEGIELTAPSGLSRLWTSWLPKLVKKHRGHWFVEPDGTKKFIGERTEEAPFFYLLDYKGINNDREKWAAISSFVRRVVDTKVRLTDRLEDMALPMAVDAKSELTLMPEDVEAKALIPIPFEFQEKVVLPARKPSPEVQGVQDKQPEPPAAPLGIPASATVAGPVPAAEDLKDATHASQMANVANSPSENVSRETSDVEPYIKHTCKAKGLGGRYAEGCPRCEQLKAKRAVAA